MLSKFFLAFFRNFRKDLVYSLINLFGFTIGIASFLLIILFLNHELSYDRYHENSENIYRLGIKAMIGDTKINQTYSSSRNFREMSSLFPEIENGTKFINWNNGTVKYEEKAFSERGIRFADSTLFDVFTIPLIYGTRETALNRPNTVAISESYWHKYFGEDDPVGKSLKFIGDYVGEIDLEVSAVFRDIPANSHNRFHLVGSLITFPDLLASDGWSNNNFVTYFLLNPNTDVKALEDKMLQYTKDHFGSDRYQEWASQGNFWEFFLQPLTDIHLKSDLNGEFEANGDIKNIYIFSVIGFFVLLIACINFMNLATARSARRAREVGIRKVTGSTRVLLISQFLFESVLLTVVSVILALVTVRLVLPWFNDWLGLDLGFGLFGSWYMLLLILMGGILIGIIAGIYPAFFLSSYRPVRVLKSQTLPSKGGFGIRNALVTFQFAASIFLIIGTLMVNRQMRFLRNTDLGFEKGNVLVITSQPEFTDKFESFRQEMLGNTMVREVTGTNGLPGYSFSNIGFRSQYVEQSFTLNIFVADESFDDVLGLEMAEGRFFSNDFPSDTAGVILNETAVRVLGLEDPLGKTLSDNVTTDRFYTIIGVVKDFNYESMHSEVRPMGIFHIRGSFSRPMSFMAVRFDEGAHSEVTALAGDLWKEMLPGAPFVYSYLDDDYESLYHNEKQTSQVFAFLAILAIIVACLGLLGLAAFMTQQKTRQIAVRKVFGASEGQIVSLLSIRFVRWVLISFVIACPVGWWVMSGWLRNFVYKADIAWWIFVLAGIIALAIALATISSVTLKAARMNAAEALKYE